MMKQSLVELQKKMQNSLSYIRKVMLGIGGSETGGIPQVMIHARNTERVMKKQILRIMCRMMRTYGSKSQ